LSKPYPLKEHDEYSFEFVTDHGIHYVVYFLDYSAMFGDYPHIASQVYFIDGVEIYNLWIVHKSNAKPAEIIIAYKELNEKAADK
jgi:hypothetical protein